MPITVQGGHWGQLNSHSEVLHHLEQETRVLWEIVCRINIPDWVTWRKIANSVDEAGRPVALRRGKRYLVLERKEALGEKLKGQAGQLKGWMDPGGFLRRES